MGLDGYKSTTHKKSQAKRQRNLIVNQASWKQPETVELHWITAGDPAHSIIQILDRTQLQDDHQSAECPAKI